MDDIVGGLVGVGEPAGDFVWVEVFDGGAEGEWAWVVVAVLGDHAVGVDGVAVDAGYGACFHATDFEAEVAVGLAEFVGGVVACASALDGFHAVVELSAEEGSGADDDGVCGDFFLCVGEDSADGVVVEDEVFDLELFEG